VLTIVGMVGTPFLAPMGGVVGAVDVQHDVEGHAVPLPLLQVHVDQGVGQAQTGVPIHRVLQARHRGLAGQVAVALGPAATDQLEQRISAQSVGVVLVLVAAGDAEDALAHQRLDGVLDVRVAPLRDARSQRRADTNDPFGFGQLGQAAVRRQTPAIEGGFQGQGGGRGERIACCGRLRRHGVLLATAESLDNSTIAHRTPCRNLMNNPG